LCGCHAIEGDLDEVISNPIASNILKIADFLTSEVDAIPAPFSLAQQWIRIGKRWDRWKTISVSSTTCYITSKHQLT